MEEAGDDGFSRDSSRVAPHNLAVDVAAVAAALPPSRPPGPYLPFGRVPPDAQGTAASGLDLRWPASRSRFRWDPDTQLWTRSDLPSPRGFGFTTVIALTVQVRYGGRTDSAGTPVPTMVTEGAGTGTIATGDRAFEVRWSKAAPEAPWSFTHEPAPSAGDQGAAGDEPFLVPPGRVWLALLPEEGGSVAVVPAPQDRGP
jgi:hypothetical protein